MDSEARSLKVERDQLRFEIIQLKEKAKNFSHLDFEKNSLDDKMQSVSRLLDCKVLPLCDKYKLSTLNLVLYLTLTKVQKLNFKDICFLLLSAVDSILILENLTVKMIKKCLLTEIHLNLVR